MAKKTDVTVTVKVLSPFRDKYTREVYKRGRTFTADEKRVKEINAGRAKPLVELVGSAAQVEAPTEPEASTEPEATGKGKGKGEGK